MTILFSIFNSFIPHSSTQTTIAMMKYIQSMTLDWKLNKENMNCNTTFVYNINKSEEEGFIQGQVFNQKDRGKVM